ncbi:hypothetical protein P245_25775 [Comamonas thiooxydans]|uniref:Uncharacterized protein n=1 Tax=Comamonas thiooxydans TaxID=363952 RepID=A0A0E3BDK8_9BURK|nr:hypothetical protein [Comamonas thiooxydans]KGG83038.1 hypothetical protein P245_25775 [Comamonas thiooxydans]
MAIDTSIYSQVGKGGNLGDLVNSYAAGRKANIMGRLSDLQLSEAERNAAQGKAVSDAYSGSIGADGNVDYGKMYSQLASGGHGAAIPGLQKAQAEQQKAATEASAKNLDLAKKKFDYFNGSMSGLLALPEITDDALIRATSDAVNRGFLGQDQAIAFVRGMPADQKARRAMLMSGVMQSTDASKQLEALLPKVQAQNLGGRTVMVDMNPMTNPAVVGQSMERTATPGEVESARHNRASEGLTARGQNLADSRSREANANNLSRPFEVTGEDGKPVLVQQDKQGNIRPVTGYQPKSGADKALTEGQAKAMLFGSRMDASNKILDSLADAKVITSIPGSRTGFGVGSVVNALSSPKQQQLDQAKRDFINATLRRESGAAIAESEFNNAEKQYFPQVGDSKEVIKQKAENRALATRAMLAEVPESKRHVVDDVINGGTGSPARKPNADQKSKVVNFSDLK